MHETIYAPGSSQCSAPRGVMIIYIREAPSFLNNVNSAKSIHFTTFGEGHRTGAGYFDDADTL